MSSQARVEKTARDAHLDIARSAWHSAAVMLQRVYVQRQLKFALLLIYIYIHIYIYIYIYIRYWGI